jgi:hypothetical protein
MLENFGSNNPNNENALKNKGIAYLLLYVRNDMISLLSRKTAKKKIIS